MINKQGRESVSRLSRVGKMWSAALARIRSLLHTDAGAVALAKEEERKARERVRKQRKRAESRVRGQNDDVRGRVRGHSDVSADASADPPHTPPKNLSLSGAHGARISENWEPDKKTRDEATKLFGNDTERIASEFDDFRDHYLGEPGQKGLRLDWNAEARRWLRRSAKWDREHPKLPLGGKLELIERGQKRKPSSPEAAPKVTSGYYASAVSQQLAEWDRYARATRGKTMPRDKAGGWWVESEWPPDFTVAQRSASG